MAGRRITSPPAKATYPIENSALRKLAFIAWS
ncbi:hypothetical protein LTSEURB_2830, partial [Salmonella enterica subsp. enterica serovar Urbana str. R8-2977]